MVKMLRLSEVEEATGLSGTTIWRREREGAFPPRRKIAGNLVGWRSDEIENWIKDRPVKRVGSGAPTREERLQAADAAERIADLLDKAKCRNLGELVAKFPTARNLSEIAAMVEDGTGR